MKPFPKLASPLLALLVLGAGCSSSTPPSGRAPSAQAPTPAPLAQGTDCNNPYYPLKNGAKMEFATHGYGHDSHFRTEVTEATADHAKLKYHFEPSIDIDLDINCTAQGIHATSFLNLSSAMSGSQISARTISSTGELLPRDLRTGSVWTNGYEVETTNNMPDAARLGMGTSHMLMSTTNTAMGEESITVPAGTFTAMKVESKTHMHMVLGTNMPSVNTDNTTYNYYVVGKGLVKSETLDAHGVSSGMEATSIIVP